MPHLDLALSRGRKDLATADLRAWCAVLCAELNIVRDALDLPPLTPATVEAAVRTAGQGHPPQAGAE